MNKVTFLSVKLDGNVFFKTAANGSNVGIFFVSDGKSKYRLSVFDDTPCYAKLKNCAEKGYLQKGKPLWVEAEMSLYEDLAISNENWTEILAHIPEELIKKIGTCNPTAMKLPHFKVTNWDFAIPKGSPHKKGDAKPKPTPTASEEKTKGNDRKPLQLGEEWGEN